jgi:hypothetical protein
LGIPGKLLDGDEQPIEGIRGKEPSPARARAENRPTEKNEADQQREWDRQCYEHSEGSSVPETPCSSCRSGWRRPIRNGSHFLRIANFSLPAQLTDSLKLIHYSKYAIQLFIFDAVSDLFTQLLA